MTRQKLFVFFLVVFISNLAFAGPTKVGKSAKHDVSPPLRSIKSIPPAPWIYIREMPEPGEDEFPLPGPMFGKDDALQRIYSSSPSPNTPAVGQSFDGVGNINGVLPPDTNGDVGPNHYVQTVNLSYQIFNKTGTSLLGPSNTNTLWSGFGAPCQTSNSGDPIAMYDPIADRWVISQFTSASPYGQCVAVSTTPDPTGSYNRYFFQLSTTEFYDYPHMAVWPDGYYFTFNRFSNFFDGGSVVVLDRAKMLQGQAATFQEFLVNGTAGHSMLPSDLDGKVLPAAGSPNYILKLVSTSSLSQFKLHVDWTTPANSTLTGPTSIAVTGYTQLCPTTRNCIDQPSTNVDLDDLGDRILHRVAYRNFGTYEALVATHGVDTVSGNGTLSGVRWYELRRTPPASNFSLFQQGTFAPDTVNRWMPSIAMDHAGDIALGYSVSNSSVFPGIRYTGRVPSDAAGTMQIEVNVISGSGSQTHTASRWGDYAMMAVDPTDDCTFWFTTEYMPSTGPAPWKTRINSLKFSTCNACPAITVSPASLPGGTNNVPYNQTVSASGGTAPYSFIVTSGSLPNGLSLNSTTGVISGTPTANGTFNFNVTAADSAGCGGVRSYSITIGTGASVNLSIQDAQVTEGNSGTVNMNFTVQLSGPAPSEVTLDYSTADGTATDADNDYEPKTDSLVIPSGQSSGQISVVVNGDTKFEANETFVLNSTGATNATVIDGQGDGTINNDDTQPSLTINDITVKEGSSGTVNAEFTVTLSAISGTQTKVNFATVPNSATADVDYTTTSGTLTIPAEDSSGTITVPILGDAISEPNETFFVNLTAPVNATISDSQGKCTISNIKPGVVIGDTSLTEGNTGTTNADFVVTSSFAYNMDVSVNFSTLAVTATSPSDFTAVPGTVTIPALSTSNIVSVPVVGDTDIESNETFKVKLANCVNCGITDDTGIGTILNDDGGGGGTGPTLSINDISGVEGNSGQILFNFTITMSETATTNVTVQFSTVNGTATTQNLDYNAKTTTVTIPSGSLSAQVSVKVNGDTNVEVDEIFTGKLTNPVNGVIGDGFGTATIQNDD